MPPFTRPGAPKRVRPPRKSTAQARRDEKAVLLLEMDALAVQLRRRRAQRQAPATPATAHLSNSTSPPAPHDAPATATTSATMPRPPVFDDETIAAAQCYQQLLHAETDQHLWIAGLRGLLRSYEMAQERSPLHVPIVLTADPAERRETLRQYHEAKIRDAHAFVVRQCDSLDLAKPYMSMDKFADPRTGAPVITSLTVMQFPGVHSVRKVYDAMKYWMSNVELCITDELGTLTIREDDEEDGTTETENSYCSLRRVRSTLDCGVAIEGNFAVYRQFFPPTLKNAQPYGVLTIQAVDEDPLFPYEPDRRLKVDITGGMVISTTPPSPQQPNGGVTLARWASLKLVGQGGEGEPTAKRTEETSQAVMSWLQVLNQVLHERVYATN